MYGGKTMENNDINWQQVRIDAAVNVMNAILSSSILVFIFQFVFRKQISDIAVGYADKLVEELKRKTSDECG
jgi:hypothetical protein